jgi:hypothetical protein
MEYFKIKNITNELDKRNSKYNTNIEFNYVDGMRNKVVSIEPGNEIFFQCNELPLSLRKLKLNGFVIVNVISKDLFYLELNKLNKTQTKKKVEPIVDTKIVADDSNIKKFDDTKKNVSSRTKSNKNFESDNDKTVE